VPVSFGLVVVSIDPSASDDAVRVMVKRCRSGTHPDGELDERIVGFHESLRSRYPDFPPDDDDSPWMSMPLDVGIDHVSVLMSFSASSTPVLELIDELAQQFGLTIYDPQGDEITRPEDVRVPMDPAMAALIESLRPAAD
jgi:hypothetical protein